MDYRNPNRFDTASAPRRQVSHVIAGPLRYAVGGPRGGAGDVCCSAVALKRNDSSGLRSWSPIFCPNFAVADTGWRRAQGGSRGRSRLKPEGPVGSLAAYDRASRRVLPEGRCARARRRSRPLAPS